MYALKISLTIFDGHIVDPERAVESEMRDALKGHGVNPNPYGIWYIKCNNIIDEIDMRKYPLQHFHLDCLSEEHIDWNKGQISIVFFNINIFHRRLKRDI